MKRQRRPSAGRKDKRKGFRGVFADRMRELQVIDRRAGGVADPTVLVDQESIRRAIAAQMCPFCERGPFKMLPVHTNKIHGVDKWELREMAGYSTTDPLCSEEARAAMSDAYDTANLERLRAAQSARKGSREPRRLTTAGLQRNAASLAAWEAANPDQAAKARQAALARTKEPDAIAKQSAAMKARYAADPSLRERLRDPARQARATAAAAVANRRPAPEHGNLNRYKHHGCRCEPCRAAKAADRKASKTRRHEEQGAGHPAP